MLKFKQKWLLFEFLSKTFKKLVFVLAISLLMTKDNIINTLLLLKQIPYIYYLLYFWKIIINIKAFINFVSKIKAITPAYAARLGFKFWPTNANA